MSEPLPTFRPGQKVRILSPFAKLKWGKIDKPWLANLDRSTLQKVEMSKQVVCYWVKCGPQEFMHGYFEHELEPIL